MSEKTFFIADTHFGDEAIIRYENRPFQDIQVMECQLVKNWNEVVRPEDRIFVLGDFAKGDKAELTRLCRCLNGKKTLILGNHDTQTPEWYRECGFDEASAWPIILKAFGFCPMNRCMSMKICLMPIFTGMFMETPSTKTLVANPCVFVLNVSAIGQLPLKIYGEKCWAVK